MTDQGNNPNSLDTFVRLLANGQSSEAKKLISDAQKYQPGGAVFFALQGLNAVYTAQAPLAKAFFRRALESRDVIPFFHEALFDAVAKLNGLELLSTAVRMVKPPADSIGHFKLIAKLAIASNDSVWAISAFSTLTEAEPENADAFEQLGLAYLADGKLTEARNALERAVTIAPEKVGAVANLGKVVYDLGEFEAAQALQRRALKHLPQHSALHYALGNSLMRLGDNLAAEKAFETCLSLDPSHVDAHVHLGMLLLLREEWNRGYAEYNWRWRSQSFPNHAPNLPRWRPTDRTPQARHLLVIAEQGFGDALQFVRFVPELKSLAARITVAAQPPLIDLFRTSLPNEIDIIALPGLDTSADTWVAAMDLAHLLKKQAAEWWPSTSYLRADPEKLGQAMTMLCAAGLSAEFRVGLVWQGSHNHPNDRNRSIPESLIAKLIDNAPGIQWVSLQVPPIAIKYNKGSMLHPGDALRSFADTAAILSHLDLVITVDTAVAHLAGGMGVKTWVLLPAAPDWRWGLERATTLWYPSFTLYRQRTPGNWLEVIHRIISDLSDRAP